MNKFEKPLLETLFANNFADASTAINSLIMRSSNKLVPEPKNNFLWF